MPRYLVVANQTLGGEGLMEEIRRRMAARRSSFHVLVPQARPPQGGALEWVARGETSPFYQQPADEAAWHRALLSSQARLAQLIARIQTEGGEAEGELGNPDPVKAIDSLMNRGEHFDEVIISTLPTGMSRWLRMDLPHRIERKYKLPVTTVTAKRETARSLTLPRH